MLLQSPRGLHYPITVTELLKHEGDNAKRQAPLFAYFYKSTVTEGDKLGNEYQVEKKFPARFESSIEGVLKQWHTGEGAIIMQPGQPLAEIEEPCPHDVQFGGLCGKCGKDMTESSYVTEQLDVTRATINMVHDNITLKVSQSEANRVEDEAKRRLLASEKLTLVVDLDQTIIHATVDPTVAEWQKDENHPNYDAVKDVQAFQLADDGGRTRRCWYYIKFRPGLSEFLENISKIYELHIYTMGTRAYAENIAKLVDPQRKFFGDRILSRNESGSLDEKSLQRLFPIDTKMVVIIDDRGDIWKYNDNLIKVTPYNFFVGIGDINSAFLPKKPGLPSSTEAPAAAVSPLNDDATKGATKVQGGPEVNGDKTAHKSTNSQASSEAGGNPSSALEQLVSMGGGDDPNVLQAQTDQQDEALVAQLQDRPLLQKQLQLEADETANDEGALNDESTTASSMDATQKTERPRHNLLHNDDRELHYLERSLRRVHSDFFDAYHRELASAKGGRIAQLRGTKRKQPPTESFDLDIVPDVKELMPKIKTSVFRGLVFVFSSVIPIGYDIRTSEFGALSKSFGARVEDNVTKRTTHLIAAKARTAKCRQAAKRGKGKVKIVNPRWLADCVARWEKVDETPYLFDVEDPAGGSNQNKDEFIDVDDEDEVLSESEDAVSSFETTDDDNANQEARSTGRKLDSRTSSGLSLNTNLSNNHDNEEEESDTEGLLPSALQDPRSPVGGTNEDWKSMEDEMAEFLGSDVEDTEDDLDSLSHLSATSEKSDNIPRGGKKRARSDVSDSEADTATDRKRQATGRGTVLSQEIRASSGEPDSPEATGGGTINGHVPEDGEQGEEEEDDDDDFADDLEREMERAAEEDEAKAAAEAREAG